MPAFYSFFIYTITKACNTNRTLKHIKKKTSKNITTRTVKTKGSFTKCPELMKKNGNILN